MPYVLSARLVDFDQHTVKLVSKLENKKALTVPTKDFSGCPVFSDSRTHYRAISTELVRIKFTAHSFSAFGSQALSADFIHFQQEVVAAHIVAAIAGKIQPDDTVDHVQRSGP